MGKGTGTQPKKRFIGGIRNSLRAQLGLIVLLSYLLPVLLLGVFTGSLLLHKLEEQTRTAVSSGAEQAWTLTVQNIDRTLELARDATYDGELTDAWQKWKSEEIGDADLLSVAGIGREEDAHREHQDEHDGNGDQQVLDDPVTEKALDFLEEGTGLILLAGAHNTFLIMPQARIPMPVMASRRPKMLSKNLIKS